MIESPPEFELNFKKTELFNKLTNNGELRKIQNEYLYWDKIKYKAKDCTPLELWQIIRFERFLQSKRLWFGKYQFSYWVTDYIGQALHQFDMHIGGTLSSNIGIAESDKHKFIFNSIIEEAISSSQIEGAVTTRKQAKEMIQKEKKPRSKSEKMILNNFYTMQHIVQHKNETLGVEQILAVHKLMTDGTLDNPVDAGRFRDNDDVFVIDHISSEIVHNPPSHQEVPGLIDDLCRFFNTDTDAFIHPIIKGCIIHFMIGWIHPFVDGNGRTARALFYWYMLRKGYWLTEYLSISRIIKDAKSQYEKAYLYTEVDGNDLGYFITWHIRTMEKAYDALKEYINRKQKEVHQAARFMKIAGVNERMAQILKILNDDADRVLTIKEVEVRFGVSNFTARTDMRGLVELGFVDAIQVNKKKQHFIRSSGFDKALRRFDMQK